MEATHENFTEGGESVVQNRDLQKPNPPEMKQKSFKCDLCDKQLNHKKGMWQFT